MSFLISLLVGYFDVLSVLLLGLELLLQSLNFFLLLLDNGVPVAWVHSRFYWILFLFGFVLVIHSNQGALSLLQGFHFFLSLSDIRANVVLNKVVSARVISEEHLLLLNDHLLVLIVWICRGSLLDVLSHTSKNI